MENTKKSNCCNAPIISDTDFCSECKEHCSKNIEVSKKMQSHLTKICKYCKGTGKDIFNTEEDCPNCIKAHRK